MSRIGRKPIIIPNGVEIKIQDQLVTVKGPKGELKTEIYPLVSVNQSVNEENVNILSVSVEHPTIKNERAQWGTARAILANLVAGVTEGFTRQLEVNGVGYKVELSGKIITLNVGYSHVVKYDLPETVEAKIEGNVITLSSINKELLGKVAAEIRKVRKPEPYKGKGIKYMEEVIRRKAGKAAKAA